MLSAPFRSLRWEAGTISVYSASCKSCNCSQRYASLLGPKLQRNWSIVAVSSAFHQGPHPSHPLRGESLWSLPGQQALLLQSQIEAFASYPFPESVIFPTPAPESLGQPLMRGLLFPDSIWLSSLPGHRKAKELNCVKNALFEDRAIMHIPAWQQGQQSLAKNHTAP